MNINECALVRDLLPLYEEEMLSPESRDFVSGHLSRCPDCRSQSSAHCEKPAEIPEALPLGSLKLKLRARRLLCTLLGLVLAAIALVCVYSALNTPQFFPYSEDLLTLQSVGNDLTVNFAPGVTDFDIYESSDPDSGITTYSIEAWSSLWKERNSPSGRWQTTIEGGTDAVVYYVQNNGSEDVCIHGADKISGGRVTLPALRLSYYLLIMALLFALLITARIIFRRKNFKGAFEIAALYPLAYLISPLLLRIGSVSYSFMRDFTLILSVSGLVFLFLLFLRELWKCRK